MGAFPLPPRLQLAAAFVKANVDFYPDASVSSHTVVGESSVCFTRNLELADFRQIGWFITNKPQFSRTVRGISINEETNLEDSELTKNSRRERTCTSDCTRAFIPTVCILHLYMYALQIRYKSGSE